MIDPKEEPITEQGQAVVHDFIGRWIRATLRDYPDLTVYDLLALYQEYQDSRCTWQTGVKKL